MDTEVAEQFEYVREQLDRLASRLEDLSGRVSQVERNVDEGKNDHWDVSGRVESLQSDVYRLQDEMRYR